jgi:hypothetical protein
VVRRSSDAARGDRARAARSSVAAKAVVRRRAAQEEVCHMSKLAWALLGAAWVSFAVEASALAANRKVCVEVVLQRASARPAAKPVAPPAGAPAEAAPAARPGEDPGVVVAGSDADVLPPQAGTDRTKVAPNLPIGQRPLGYLKRLLEHYVSHEKGFQAVDGGCEDTLRVELYPLLDGWTAFARYSGTGREERIDRLTPTELSPFAERAATALLYGKPISSTINRENVLSADSKEYAQRIGGTHHFILGVGTQLRFGKFGTAVDDPSSPSNGKAIEKTRFFSPVSALMGYRGRFENWGVEANVLGSLGTSKTSISKNPGGGHIDFLGDGAMQLHFLHYFDPRGLMSLYLGGGTSFELLVFQAVRAADKRQTGDRSYLYGGGLDVDAVIGCEFMRASGVQFFLQAELQAPAYVLANESADGGLHGWFPSLGIKLGVMF